MLDSGQEYVLVFGVVLFADFAVASLGGDPGHHLG